MFDESVIGKTGQMWKLVVSIAALLVGSFGPFFPAIGLSWTTGTVLAIVGYCFGVVLILCPRCNSRWFWVALMRAELYKPLMTRPECPSCNHDFSDQSS